MREFRLVILNATAEPSISNIEFVEKQRIMKSLQLAGVMRSAAVVASLVIATTVFAAARPNIVFFLVDDMGWQETSVPFHREVTELNRRYRTPNMERLAAEGMKFTQAYASAVCSPTRASCLTGRNRLC